MADIETTIRSAPDRTRRLSEPVPLGAILPGVCTAIQARCKRAVRRLRSQRRAPSRAAHLAG